MHDMQHLQRIAEFLYSDTNTRRWIFSHTKDEAEYRQVRQALRTLAKYQPVEWTGPTGHREPVPMKMEAAV